MSDIFALCRDSVKEIVDELSKVPQVSAAQFIGQGSRGVNKGTSSKEQQAIIRAFRDGIYNTLVSTSIGEEGLDIGEVDLIISFDVPKSPISLVQRSVRLSIT